MCLLYAHLFCFINEYSKQIVRNKWVRNSPETHFNKKCYVMPYCYWQWNCWRGKWLSADICNWIAFCLYISSHVTVNIGVFTLTHFSFYFHKPLDYGPGWPKHAADIIETVSCVFCPPNASPCTVTSPWLTQTKSLYCRECLGGSDTGTINYKPQDIFPLSRIN